MCLLTADGLSTYGTVLEIIHHKVLPDARLLTVSKGRERFRLVKIVQERPVLLCEVEYLEDEVDEEALKPAADELKSLFRDVLKLNARYKNMPVDEEFLVRSSLSIARSMRTDAAHTLYAVTLRATILGFKSAM